jgi:hypothetical protein
MVKIGKILCLCLAVLWFSMPLISGRSYASEIESKQNDLLGVKSETKNWSLLDPQRLKLHHSYTFSYFSNSKYSGSMGVYTTTLGYQLSDPLSLTLSLNYLHQPLSVFGKDDTRLKSDILPNFQLHYNPGNSFSLWINVVTLPSSYGWGYEDLWREHRR